ncbi:NADH-quinone oxidoreductase subunit M [Parathermosynechococcus lividus]
MATPVMPLLSIVLLVPLLGALALSLLPQTSGGRTYRSLAAVVMAIALVVSLAIARLFDPSNAAPQLTEALPWLDTLGLSYRLSVDGLSLPLVVLNNFLTLIALWATSVNLPRPRLYYPLVLLLNAGVNGAFLADNLLLFFLFYELELIPLYLLIAIWGGARRSYAATKFLIYTAISGVLLLAGFLGLVWLAGASSFDFDPQRSTLLPLTSQLILLGLILVGFGIKIPLVPFHTWLPDAHVEASTPISVLLAGVLLKLGTYGLVRFGVQLFPHAWQVVAPVLATWAVVSVLYGSLMAIAQTDMKKMVAYSSIGHMGFVLLATATATPLSILAAIAQMVSHGLISALLFLLVGVVYEKTGSRNIETLRGLLNPERGLPLIGSLMIVGVMASGGIPGMVGFVAEFLIFRSSFLTFPVQTLLCLVGTGLTAVYFLLLVNRVFFGRLSNDLTELPPVAWGDRLPGLVLAALILILGIVPNWLIHWSESTVSLLTPTVATLMPL